VNALYEWSTLRMFRNGIRETMREKTNLVKYNTI